MPALTQEALVAQVAAGALQPVYLIVGDDDVAKDDAIRALQAAVPEDAQPFAFERHSALDKLDPATIVTSARTLPFLGDRRVIVVTGAEKWFTGKRKGGEDAGAGEDDDAGSVDVLEAYFERVEPASTVAFVAADVNRTLRTVKALLKTAAVIECWGLKGEKDPRGQAAGEVMGRAGRLVAGLLKRAGMTIDRAAVEPLLAHAGTDIGVLRGDVERLTLYCHGRKTVTADDVHAVVSGTALLNPWGVVNAVERGDAREALRQLRVVTEAGEAPYMTLGQIGWWVRNKLPQMGSPDRVRAAVDAVFRTDLAMKSSGGEPRILLERLVVELCARAGSRGGGAATRRAWP
jgi:DNA polymerase-3 subunit delta